MRLYSNWFLIQTLAFSKVLKFLAQSSYQLGCYDAWSFATAMTEPILVISYRPSPFIFTLKVFPSMSKKSSFPFLFGSFDDARNHDISVAQAMSCTGCPSRSQCMNVWSSYPLYIKVVEGQIAFSVNIGLWKDEGLLLDHLFGSLFIRQCYSRIVFNSPIGPHAKSTLLSQTIWPEYFRTKANSIWSICKFQNMYYA